MVKKKVESKEKMTWKKKVKILKNRNLILSFIMIISLRYNNEIICWSLLFAKKYTHTQNTIQLYANVM